MTVFRPTLTPRELLRCPACHNQIATPVALNPRTGRQEKMVLIPRRVGQCPACGVPIMVDEVTAEAHNRYWHLDCQQYEPARN